MPEIEIETDRQQLCIILDRMHAALKKPDHSGAASLAQMRWELARRLFPYLTVDGLLDPARQPSSAALLDRVRAHFQDWNSVRIGADWPGYQKETSGLVRSLRHHLA